MKYIELTQGKQAIVDDEDHGSVNRFKWYAEKTKHTWYAGHKTKVMTTRMHRFITGAADGWQVDHINGDGLDNRRCNLRVTNFSGNQANAKKRRGCSSEYKGVYLHKATGKWIARTGGAGYCYIGGFKTEVDAAKAYDKKAKELYGEFARTNF